MILKRIFSTKLLLSLSLLLLPYSNSWAQEKDLPKPASTEVSETEETQYRAPAVEVIGSERNLELIPGSGTVLGEDQIEREKFTSVQEALRETPGVHYRGEDGIGLTPNIGIRGVNPDRSEKILILEDGMPAGLAPFSENAAYYIPPVERMEKVELLKGSGSILYGPQTVGGVLNLVTPKIPKDYRSKIRFDGGTDAYLLGHGTFGKTWGPFGIDISLLHKQGDGFRQASDFRLSNFTGKMQLNLGDKTKLILKNNYHDQNSSQTYLGLTEALFHANPDFNPAPFDLLEVSRYDLQFTLQHFFTEEIEFITNVYYWNATRNWNRQDFARNTGLAAAPGNTSATYGDTSINGGAIYMRESFGSRDRDFQAVGVEPRLLMDYDLWGKKHHLHAGVKFFWEEMIDARNNRTSLIAAPVTQSRDNRSTYDFAFFLQNTFRVTDRLSVIPGFRLEHYQQKRHQLITSGAAVDIEGDSTNTVLIPGFGITYQLPWETTLFTGIHRGFAPPRTSQAISSSGQDLDLDAENSWNYELGVRTQAKKWWKAEGTFFFMDFTNQVVPANQSGGASTADTNAGETRHIGFELANTIDVLGALGIEDHKLALEGQYTFSETENTTPSGTFQGKDLPYAPQHLAQVAVRYQAKEGPLKGFEIGTEGIFVSSQFADQANTVAASSNGTIGKIPSYWLMNAYARYKIPKTRLELSVVGNNLLDNNYIASRAPEGVFPGAGLQILGGLKYDL